MDRYPTPDKEYHFNKKERITNLLYRYFMDTVTTEHASVNLAETNPAWIYAAVCLVILSLLLMMSLYVIRYGTVRIYNWNGARYCYLGRTGVRRCGGGYQVRIGEWMADQSYTTLYQICLSGRFVRRNRYRDMMLCAGHSRCLLHVDECMMQSIYYR